MLTSRREPMKACLLSVPLRSKSEEPGGARPKKHRVPIRDHVFSWGPFLVRVDSMLREAELTACFNYADFACEGFLVAPVVVNRLLVVTDDDRRWG